MDRTNPLAWRKARASAAGDNCVEVADLQDGSRAVRDSKDPEGPMLTFTPDEWAAFLVGVKGGEFD